MEGVSTFKQKDCKKNNFIKKTMSYCNLPLNKYLSKH